MSENLHPGDLLSAYLDGELTPVEHAGVDGHLAGCAVCRDEVAELRSVRGTVRSLPLLDPPAAALAAPDPSDHPIELLSAFLDGELVTGEYEMVTVHLESCSYCREELREVDAARTATRSLPVLEVPESTLTIPIPVPVPIGAARSAVRRRRATRWVAAAAAASVLVAGVAVSRSEPADVDLDVLANRHVARLSVEQTFGAVPALSPVGGAP